MLKSSTGKLMEWSDKDDWNGYEVYYLQCNDATLGYVIENLTFKGHWLGFAIVDDQYKQIDAGIYRENVQRSVEAVAGGLT